MKMDRRSFLKGMLAISTAAVVLPMLPAAEIEAAPFVIQGETLANAPTTGTVLRSMGRLGRVRIDKMWFPLEDASLTMMRRHARLVSVSDVVLQPRPLVLSPWQVQIWTPDQEIGSLFANMDELEFEFESRPISFVGNGFITQMETENLISGNIDGNPTLFSVTLEGDTKLRRYGEVREELEF